MAAPYGPENARVAQRILSDAHDRLVEAGLGEVEAAHALIHMGIDALPDCCCVEHLLGELAVAAAAIEDRLDALRAAAK